MKYYLDSSTSVIHGYSDDGSQDQYINPAYTALTQQEYEDFIAERPTVVKTPVPIEVTMRQARMAILVAGLQETVSTVLNSLPSPQKEAVLIEWEYSQFVQRNRPFVVSLGSALGLTSTQLDDLFILAATL